MFQIVFFRSGKSEISALALLLVHWDHLQFGLCLEIKLLNLVWTNINSFISAGVHRGRNKTTHILVA